MVLEFSVVILLQCQQSQEKPIRINRVGFFHAKDGVPYAHETEAAMLLSRLSGAGGRTVL